MARLQVGEPAPDFTLPDAAGRPVSLVDYAGRRVIVYFYPAALTPGCTTQAVDFTASQSDLDAAGFDILGISPDPVDKLARFASAERLGVTLLSDADLSVLKAYGAYGVKLLYGKEITGVIRSTFVLDVAADGSATVSLAQFNVKATGHVAKLRRDLGV